MMENNKLHDNRKTGCDFYTFSSSVGVEHRLKATRNKEICVILCKVGFPLKSTNIFIEK